MPLFLLLPKNKRPRGYDCADGFVIRAKTEERARELAAKGCGDEGPEYWLSDRYTVVTTVYAHGREAEILRSFHAG